MNRLVIIGNGFDLAHGLPTGYGHFIDWFWGKVIENIKLPLYERRPTYCEFEFINIQFQFDADYYELQYICEEFKSVKNFTQLNDILQKYHLSNDDGREINPNERINNCKLSIKNHFFKTINDRKQIQTWVDIENEYYKLLKNCLKDEDNAKVVKLNEEFEQVKTLLEKYLTEEISQKIDFKRPPKETIHLLNHLNIKPKDLSTSDGIQYLKEFPNEDYENIKKYNEYLQLAGDDLYNQVVIGKIIPKKTVFLNFNYTPTINTYLNLIEESLGLNGNFRQVQIHGRLNDINNPINFGFGDEMDNHYKLIEEKEDNEYLKNIKSFQYLQNSNYKDLLDFIDSEKFQVYIMGHSCGLSDRILLNTIFEHEKCRSIKVFYHKYDEPKPDGRTDDYTNIVQNISRHFNKKKMMRDKIVNKSLCQPLPQDIRFAPK